VEGEPELDLFPWDMARYGDWATKAFTKARVHDCYSHRFKIHFPYEERDAGRPLRTRPIYERQKSMGALFGLNYGWEHPLWFARDGVEAVDEYGFERQNWFDPVGAECAAVRAGVGVLDVSNFAKYEVRGPGAGDWLDKVMANKIPRVVSRTCLTPLLGIRGGIAGDFTVTMLDDDHYLIIGSGMAERYHIRYFNMVPRPAGVSFETRTKEWTGFNVAGPKARDLLTRLTNEDLSTESFPFMRSRRVSVSGIDGVAIRVSFTGDLGWEIYVPERDQPALYDKLFEAGESLGVRPVGGRALMSMRIEKGYGSWGREYSPEYWPQEVGLDRLIKLDKPEFLGRDAWLKLKEREPREKLVILEIEATTADASGGEPVFMADGTPVGRISSGAYGYSVDKSLALAFIKTPFISVEAEYDVAVLGQSHRAKMLPEAPFDPKGLRLRA
jgi:dimethylglycine dehydrogenase